MHRGLTQRINDTDEQMSRPLLFPGLAPLHWQAPLCSLCYSHLAESWSSLMTVYWGSLMDHIWVWGHLKKCITGQIPHW